MEITNLKSQGLKKFFVANISKEYIAKKELQELENISKTVNLKGFRKGKIPLDIIKKNYRQSVLVRVFEALTREILLKIFNEHKVTPVTEPKINITKGDIKEKEDITLSLELDTYPEIPEIDLKNITIDKINLDITEKDVEDFLRKLTEYYYDYTDLNESRPLKIGDTVSIDFTGYIDKVAFEGGSAKNFSLELGSKSFIEGFEEQLVGAKPGDELKIEVVFPKDYKFKPEYSAKKAIFEVKVNNIKQKVNSKIEDLPKKLGFSSLEDLKNNVKERHLSQYKNVLNNYLKQQVADSIVKLVDFLLPESLVDKEKLSMKQDYEKYKQLKSSNKNPPSSIAYDNKSEEDIIKEQSEAANKKIKLSLIFNHLAEINNILILPEEVDQFIKTEATKFVGKEKDFINHYKNDKNLLNNIKSLLLEDKILNFIYSNINYNEKNMSLAEYNEYIAQSNNK